MTLAEFANLLDRYGSDPASWPPDVRHHANAILGTLPEATALLAEAQAVEKLVRNHAPTPDISPEVMARLHRATMARLPQSSRFSWRDRLAKLIPSSAPAVTWAPRFAMAIAAAAILGITAGGQLSYRMSPTSSSTEMFAMSTYYLPLDVR